jgi:hypothetical protein
MSRSGKDVGSLFYRKRCFSEVFYTPVRFEKLPSFRKLFKTHRLKTPGGNERMPVRIVGGKSTIAGNCSCVFSSTSRKDEVDENAQAYERLRH